jgi:hypothetical protein
MLFRPRCPACSACVSLRVDVARFVPDRSQRRAMKANADVALDIGEPSLTHEKLALYERYHAYRAATRGWPWRGEDPYSFHGSFVSNPFPTEEWRYTLDGRLVGLGYVDALPAGLSAIYFVYEPAEADRGLGTGNVLRLIAEARARELLPRGPLHFAGLQGAIPPVPGPRPRRPVARRGDVRRPGWSVWPPLPPGGPETDFRKRPSAQRAAVHFVPSPLPGSLSVIGRPWPRV